MHHDAQKFTTTGLPRSSDNLYVCPSNVVKVKSGAVPDANGPAPRSRTAIANTTSSAITINATAPKIINGPQRRFDDAGTTTSLILFQFLFNAGAIFVGHRARCSSRRGCRFHAARGK